MLPNHSGFAISMLDSESDGKSLLDDGLSEERYLLHANDSDLQDSDPQRDWNYQLYQIIDKLISLVH